MFVQLHEDRVALRGRQTGSREIVSQPVHRLPIGQISGKQMAEDANLTHLSAICARPRGDNWPTK